MLHQKMLAVIGAVNATVAERGELIDMIALALLTRKNLFVLGAVGMINQFNFIWIFGDGDINHIGGIFYGKAR